MNSGVKHSATVSLCKTDILNHTVKVAEYRREYNQLYKNIIKKKYPVWVFSTCSFFAVFSNNKVNKLDKNSNNEAPLTAINTPAV